MALVLVQVSEEGEMIDCHDGNIAGGVDTSCHWYGSDGYCQDEDHDCPLEWPECCWGCRIADQCKSVCANVAVGK
jgi:hypothetical protein